MRLAPLVLEHYRRHARDFPWRRSRDPYAIWICEVMAQQTRLETMLPYWQRWMVRFPDPVALAAAPLDDVLASWAGLGYYARARSLHAAAKRIASEHGGRFPQRPEEIAALPGIGPYTAGAVGSIAFGHVLPVVDGNVARVLARVYAVEDASAPAGRRHLWELATAAVPNDAPGDFNQGLMDIGATICTPRAPRCLICPLAEVCRARRDGRQAELPAPRIRAVVKEQTVELAWVVSKGSWLLARRAPDGLYGGLWELPEVAALAGVRLEKEPAATRIQKLSHRTFMYRAYAAQLSELPVAVPPYDSFRFVSPDGLAVLGISSATAALVRLLQKGNAWPTPKRRSRNSSAVSSTSSPGSESSVTTSKTTKTSARPRRARRAGSQS